MRTDDMNDEKNFSISVKTKHVSFLADIFRLIKRIDPSAHIMEIKNNMKFPDVSEFMMDEEKHNRNIPIKYDEKTLMLSKKELVKYCIQILRRHESIQCINQFKLLKSYGITESNLYAMFDFNVQELNSLENGSPFPYVEKKWNEIFSFIALEVRDKIEKQKIDKVFGSDSIDSKKFEEPKKFVKEMTFREFSNVLKKQEEDKIYKKYPELSKKFYAKVMRIEDKDVTEAIISKVKKVFGVKLTFDDSELFKKVKTIDSLICQTKNGTIANAIFVRNNIGHVYYTIIKGKRPTKTIIDSINRKFGSNIAYY